MHLNFFVLLALMPAAFAVLPVGYDLLSASDKRDVLVGLINARPYPGVLPNSDPGLFSMANLFRPSFLVKVFTASQDEFSPEGSQKLIHTYGSVAPVELKIFPNSTYTGIFTAGLFSKALVRLSLAKQDLNNFTPGMALKVLIDGQASKNIFAMFSLDGQGANRNFLQNTFWNKIADPTGLALKLLAKAFSLSIGLIPGPSIDKPEAEGNMPLYEHAAVDSLGNTVASVRAPYRISFIPNPALGWSPSSPNDFRVNLAAIPSGSVLYTIGVNRELSQPEEIIGQLVTQGPFVASEYGDKKLFFQHPTKRWRQ